MAARNGQTMAAAHPARPLYQAIWRWHFYAGLFCIPFVLWLAATGSVYLFKPQIEAWIDRGLDHLAIGAPAPAAAQVQAALAAVPGGRLSAYELPASPASAARVVVARGGEKIRVYVDPERLTVLKRIDERDRLLNQVFRLHGELMLGNAGSYLVELAASWAIVMLLSGLYLWWPRDGRGLAGVLWPRLGAEGRRFWRDLHAVTGFWISAFALALLLSGLPWTRFWGGNLKSLRDYAAGAPVRQDWSTGHDRAADAGGEHAGHHHGGGAAAPAFEPASSSASAALARVIATAAPLALAPPVLVEPPAGPGAPWTVKSDAQNRPRRATVWIDGDSGAVVRREDFAQRPLLDRVIGTGIAAHEGQLFGALNQALGLATALGLMTLSASAVVLWWRRRPAGRLGAPLAPPSPRIGAALLATIAALGTLLPLFGASLLAVLLLERQLLRRIAPARTFLGLA